MILFKRTWDHRLPVPSRGTQDAAGLDICAAEDAILMPGERRVIKTGWAMKIPCTFVGLIRPRSGLAVRHGLHVMAGVIDADYRGEIGVLAINLGYEPMSINGGDRIAQLLIMPVLALGGREVEAFTDATDRGEGGWGSTGVASGVTA